MGLEIDETSVEVAVHGDKMSVTGDLKIPGIFSGHTHSIHRSVFFKEEDRPYAYLFDTVENLDFINKDLIGIWEEKLNLHLATYTVGSSISFTNDKNTRFYAQELDCTIDKDPEDCK